MNRIHFLLIFAVAAASCNQMESRNHNDTSGGDTLSFLTGLGYQPELRTTDSIVILYFEKDSSETDRYQRYFTTHHSREPEIINALLRSLDQPIQEFFKAKSCKSEGKIYLYKTGTEFPLQTIFFRTGIDSCSYNYYISNGKFYYMPITSELDSLLNMVEPSGQ